MKTLTYFFEISVNQLPTSGGFVQQITKADRDACHALRRMGKARATLRRLSSTVLQERKSSRDSKQGIIFR